MWVIIIFFLLGCVAGTASGLLGVGGGIIIVPGLVWLYTRLGFQHSVLMHMAAGTSLAIICLGSFSAVIVRRHQLKKIYTEIVPMLPGLIIGSLIGSFLASLLEGRVLMILFAVLLCAIAVRMWMDRYHEAKPAEKPSMTVMSSFGVIVGVKSGLLGIGGGILSVPFFTHVGVDVRKAMSLSVLVSLTVALFGALSFVYHGWRLPGLPPHAWGYVYWPALIGTLLGSLLFAPFGVWLHKLLPAKILRKTFAILLVAVAVKLVF